MNCLDISNGEMVCPTTEIGDALVILPNTGIDVSLWIVVAFALIFAGLFTLLFLRIVNPRSRSTKQATDRPDF